MTSLIIAYSLLSMALLLGIAAIDMSGKKKHLCLSYALALMSILLFLISGQLDYASSCILAVMLSLGFLIPRAISPEIKVNHRYFLVSLVSLITALLALTVSLHLLSGIENVVIDSALQVSENAKPYTLKANIDKPLAGIALMILLFFLTQNDLSDSKQQPSRTSWLLLPVYVVVFLVAAWLCGVPYDFKVSDATLVFIVTNMLFSVITEEVFFRGLIQGRVQAFFNAKTAFSGCIAIGVSSLLFGLAHLGGGLSYAIFATVSGCLYGIAYHSTGKLSAAIAVHSGVNIGHFIFFQYPFTG